MATKMNVDAFLSKAKVGSNVKIQKQSESKKIILFIIHKKTHQIIKELAKKNGYAITNFLTEVYFNRIKIDKKFPEQDWIESKTRKEDFVGITVYFNEKQLEKISLIAQERNLPLKGVFVGKIKKALFE